MKDLTVKTSAKILLNELETRIPTFLTNDDVCFICIGTDRSTGDCLGPLVGSFLTYKGYSNVFGTLHDPVHATNLAEVIKTLPQEKKIIAIDACLGTYKNIGKITLEEGPVKPGAGVKKELPEVGDYNITGNVNIGGFMEYFVLQNTRLSLVRDMASEISIALSSRFPLSSLFDISLKEIAASHDTTSKQKFL